MTSLLPKSLLASLALLTLAATSTQAAIIVTLPTVSTAGSIVFTNDINFTFTTAGTPGALILDE
jgi:hypothetical protein